MRIASVGFYTLFDLRYSTKNHEIYSLNFMVFCAKFDIKWQM